MTNPTIEHYMTHDPITIERGESMTLARRLMEAHHIRHLPVVHEGKLVGIVSQRDLLRADRIVDLDQSQVPIGEAMAAPVYSVRPDARLRDVAVQMASRHHGAVVIVDEQSRVLGLLTAGGGLRALASLDAPSGQP